MISDTTKAAVLALLAVDAGATDSEKERVKIALTDRRPNGRLIRTGDAAKMLDVHPNTVRNWIKSGRLEGVRGGGSRMIGVTEASLAAI